MNYLWIEKEIRYDGTQLSSHFAYRNFKISGDSIVSFAGPVAVNIEKMVDIEDVINNEPISSDKMLNFIVESFNLGLPGTVWMQRLLMSIIKDEINRRLDGLYVERDGDDLYYKKRKLSVSIATASPVSSMIHAAINIVETGAPVSISCLDEMSIPYISLATAILEKFSKESDNIEFARTKVNWIK